MATQTLLETCNEALLQVGEREQPSLTAPTGKKARLAVRSAIDICARMHAWRFLRVIASTTNWLNSVGTLPPFQELYQASNGTQLLYLTSPEAIQNHVIRNPEVGLPLYCSVIGENQVMVYPLPAAAVLNAIQFRLLLQPTIPDIATDVLNFPAPFFELVDLYTQVILHRTHTTDLASAEAALRDFEVRMHMHRTRDNMQHVSNLGG